VGFVRQEIEVVYCNAEADESRTGVGTASFRPSLRSGRSRFVLTFPNLTQWLKFRLVFVGTKSASASPTVYEIRNSSSSGMKGVQFISFPFG